MLAAKHGRHCAAAQRFRHRLLNCIDPAFFQAFLSGGGFYRRLRMDAEVAGTAAPVEILELPRRLQDGARPPGRAAAYETVVSIGAGMTWKNAFAAGVLGYPLSRKDGVFMA